MGSYRDHPEGRNPAYAANCSRHHDSRAARAGACANTGNLHASLPRALCVLSRFGATCYPAPPRRQLEPSLPFAQSLTFVKDGFAVTQLYELLWFCHHTIEPRRKVRTLDHATYVTVVGAMSDGGSVFIEENDLDRRCRQTEKCAKGVQRPPETKKPTKSLI